MRDWLKGECVQWDPAGILCPPGFAFVAVGGKRTKLLNRFA
jgi:hypothetical protein